MTRKWHGGKGDSRRKGSDDAYRRGWDRVFGKRESKRRPRMSNAKNAGDFTTAVQNLPQPDWARS
jgi:hypothetical protein